MSQVLILMPVYNEAEFLSDSILSVQSQLYTNWKLVIQDNCSEDNTFRLAKDFSHSDDRIAVLKNSIKKNVQDNWFTLATFALSQYESEYVIWLGGDDIWSNSNFLESKVKFLQAQLDYQSVAPGVRNLNSDPNFTISIKSKSRFKSARLTKYILDYRNINVLWALMRRTTFEKLLLHPTFYPGGFSGFDWYFGLGIFYFGKVGCDSESVYLKRVRRIVSSNSTSGRQVEFRNPYRNFMIPYLETFYSQRRRFAFLSSPIKFLIFFSLFFISHARLFRMLCTKVQALLSRVVSNE
jgi:glycosyltransferase involved in cell wall biosynthesis